MKAGITILSYIGTLGVGVGIGVLCSRSYFEKRESERADAEIESMKTALRKNYISEEKPKKQEKVIDIHTTPDITITPVANVADAYQYHTFSKPDDIRAESEHPKEDEDNKKPYFIDIDDFDEPTLGYAKKELLYYMDDGTLVDESENVDEEGQVISIVDTVGVANLESFENSLESCCYIRNEALKEDYEISKVFSSYGALIEE